MLIRDLRAAARLENVQKPYLPAASAQVLPTMDRAADGLAGASKQKDNYHARSEDCPNEALRAVAGDPYSWPFDGHWSPEDSALLIIDMQVCYAQQQSFEWWYICITSRVWAETSCHL